MSTEMSFFFLKYEYDVNLFDITNESWSNIVETFKNFIIHEETIIQKRKKTQKWIQMFITTA